MTEQAFQAVNEAQIFRSYVRDLQLIADEKGFNQWEQDFIDDIVRRDAYLHLSTKQKEKILQLVEKYDL